MRLFVGVFPPPEAVRHLSTMVDQLGLTRRIIPPGRWHITLAFVADGPADAALAAMHSLAPDTSAPDTSAPATSAPATSAAGDGTLGDATLAGRGSAAGRLALGELRFSGGGHFGNILWAGVAGDVEGLTRLSRDIRREMRARRLHPDDKRFRAHLTIARAKAAVHLLRDYKGPMWTPTELVLIHSEQGPQPVYHRLGTYPLPGPGLGAGATGADGRE